MTDIRELQTTASAMYNSEDTRKWLFSHTRSEGEYALIRHALKVLAEYQPVEWSGPAGHREPVPMKMEATV